MERFDGFYYEYWMNCECGMRSKVTAETYHERETIDARVTCEHCEGQIHYGPVVTTLRDLDDPALSTGAVNELAWYHTSTSPDWPSPRYQQNTRAMLEAGRRRRSTNFGLILKMWLTRALHVGTYETAIENMLRRMHDEADAHSTFYLHRVALNVEDNQISTLRDENQDKVSKLLIEEMAELGLRAVRYINVYESPGSVSLAIEPGVIEYVQTIALPVAELAQPISDAAREAVAEFEAEIAAAAEEMPDTAGEDDLQLRTLVVEPGDEVAEQMFVCEQRMWRAQDGLRESLAQHYLDGVSPTVGRAFVDAMASAHRDPVSLLAHDFHERFRTHAAALTAARQVRAILATEPARAPDTSIYPR